MQRDEQEDRALRSGGHRVAQQAPERVERRPGQAAEVEIRAQREGPGDEGQDQLVVRAAFAVDVQLAAQREGGAAQGMVGRELVHVVGNRARREPGGGEDGGSGEQRAAPKRQASFPFAMAAWTVVRVFSISERSASSCSSLGSWRATTSA